MGEMNRLLDHLVLRDALQAKADSTKRIRTIAEASRTLVSTSRFCLGLIVTDDPELLSRIEEGRRAIDQANAAIEEGEPLPSRLDVTVSDGQPDEEVEAVQEQLEERGRRGAQQVDRILDDIDADYLLICEKVICGQGELQTYCSSMERGEAISSLRLALKTLEKGEDVAPIRKIVRGKG